MLIPLLGFFYVLPVCVMLGYAIAIALVDRFDNGQADWRTFGWMVGTAFVPVFNIHHSVRLFIDVATWRKELFSNGES
jgi:hypothetical protein